MSATKVELANQLLAAMAPALVEELFEEARTEAGRKALVDHIIGLQKQLNGTEAAKPHWAAVLAFKLASDLVDLCVEADRVEERK